MYGSSMSSEMFARMVERQGRLEQERARLAVECAQDQADDAILARLQRRMKSAYLPGILSVQAPMVPPDMTLEERRVWRSQGRSVMNPRMACSYLKAVERRLEEVRSQPQTISTVTQERASSIPWKAIGVGAVVVGLTLFLRGR
jgi:hypothetical protein